MRTRILPPEEWPRLAGTELGEIWPILQPERVAIVVVEDGERIVGTWARQLCVHVHGFWIDPAYRRRPKVFEALADGMAISASEVGATAALTTLPSAGMKRFLQKRGATCETMHLIPLQHVADQMRGHAFHAALHALGTPPDHGEDLEHDRAVGAALRTAFSDQQPEQARADYNRWAEAHGYDPLRAIHRHADEIGLQFSAMTITVNASGHPIEVRPSCPSQL